MKDRDDLVQDILLLANDLKVPEESPVKERVAGVADTIAQQMGGLGRLRSMLSSKVAKWTYEATKQALVLSWNTKEKNTKEKNLERMTYFVDIGIEYDGQYWTNKPGWYFNVSKSQGRHFGRRRYPEEGRPVGQRIEEEGISDFPLAYKKAMSHVDSNVPDCPRNLQAKMVKDYKEKSKEIKERDNDKFGLDLDDAQQQIQRIVDLVFGRGKNVQRDGRGAFYFDIARPFHRYDAYEDKYEREQAREDDWETLSRAYGKAYKTFKESIEKLLKRYKSKGTTIIDIGEKGHIQVRVFIKG